MSQYDVQADLIKRHQMIADALRQSGNEGAQYAPPSGNRAYHHSAWEGINKALQQGLGAYQSYKAGEEKKALDKEDQAHLGDLIKSTQPSDLTYVDPGMNAQRIQPQAPDAPVYPKIDPVAGNQQIETDRQNGMRAAALRGLQYGGSSGPLASEMMTRDLFPAPKKIDRVDLGDKIGVYKDGVLSGYEKKGMSPDETAKLQMETSDKAAQRDYQNRQLKETTRAHDLEHGDRAANLDLKKIDPNDPQSVASMTAVARGDEPYPAQIFNRYPGQKPAYDAALQRINPDFRANAYDDAKATDTEFTRGMAGRIVSAQNSTVAHLQTYGKLVDAVQNGKDPQLVNRLLATMSREFGGQAVPNLEAAAGILGTEIEKAININGAGTGAEREAKAKSLGSQLASGTAHSVANTYKTMLLGQLQSQRQKFVGGKTLNKPSEKDKADVEAEFDRRFLTDDTKKSLHDSLAAAAPQPPASVVKPYADPGKEAAYQAYKKSHGG